METVTFEPVARAHVQWTAALERALEPGRPSLSRWHYAQEFEVYTRVGTASWRLAGVPVVVLANILVIPELQGQGLLRSLLTALDEAGELLQARYVILEKVGNERLAAWLRSRAWTEFALVEGDIPSFYKRRVVSVDLSD